MDVPEVRVTAPVPEGNEQSAKCEAEGDKPDPAEDTIKRMIEAAYT